MFKYFLWVSISFGAFSTFWAWPVSFAHPKMGIRSLPIVRESWNEESLRIHNDDTSARHFVNSIKGRDFLWSWILKSFRNQNFTEIHFKFFTPDGQPAEIFEGFAAGQGKDNVVAAVTIQAGHGAFFVGHLKSVVGRTIIVAGEKLGLWTLTIIMKILQ